MKFLLVATVFSAFKNSMASSLGPFSLFNSPWSKFTRFSFSSLCSDNVSTLFLSASSGACNSYYKKQRNFQFPIAKFVPCILMFR